MAILSNVNGKFAVDSTGAIQFSGQTGTSGYVLKSNGNAAPTWVDGSTVIGGPYLPLAGGTLTGATATASGISFTVGGTLTGTTATFTKDQNSDTTLKLYNPNTGTSAGANMYITNTSANADGLFLGAVGVNAASGGFIADSGIVGSGTGASGGLVLMAREASSGIRFYTGGYTDLALTINSSQNATFVGTLAAGATTITSATNPLLLTLNSTASGYGGILFQYGGATKGLSYYNSNMMIFGGEAGTATRIQSGGQYAITALTNGNIGIGTTTPGTYKLNVAGTGLFTGGLEMAGGGAVYQGQKFWLDGGGDTFLESPSSNLMTFTTGGTERMRITSAGEVNIGGYGGQFPVLKVVGLAGGIHTGSTWAISANQDGIGRTILATGGQARAMYFENDGKTVHTQLSYFNKGVKVDMNAATTFTGEFLNSNASSYGLGLRSNSGYQVFFYDTGGNIGSITSNGSNTSYNTSGSDKRLKENIEVWDENVLDKFKNLQPKTFKFIKHKQNNKTVKGYIAQNEVDNFPEAYPMIYDIDAKEDMYQFNPSGMTVYLMKAIQELEAKIKILENK